MGLQSHRRPHLQQQVKHLEADLEAGQVGLEDAAGHLTSHPTPQPFPG